MEASKQAGERQKKHGLIVGIATDRPVQHIKQAKSQSNRDKGDQMCSNPILYPPSLALRERSFMFCEHENAFYRKEISPRTSRQRDIIVSEANGV